MFVAVRRAIAGNDLYFTGTPGTINSLNYTLIDSKWFNARYVHADREALERLIAPWNRMGQGTFVIREITPEEATQAAFEQPLGVTHQQQLFAIVDCSNEGREWTKYDARNS